MPELQTILVVDDEVSILKALKRTLKRAGYQVLMAENGAAGINMLNEHPHIGVVVSDFRMPGMNGVDMLKVMKERSPSVVGLMLSGQADNEQVVDAMMEGDIMEFLPKPWNDEDLLEQIACVFERLG